MIEVDDSLDQLGVDICLLKGIHLGAIQDFRFANDIRLRTNLSTMGGGTRIRDCRGTHHHVVPVADLRYLEATAIEMKLAERPVKILAVYLSPFQPLNNSDLSAQLRGMLPVCKGRPECQARGLQL